MAETLDALRRGVSFDSVLAALVDAYPFAGMEWVVSPDIAAAYDVADVWVGPEGPYEAASEDLAVAEEEGLISVEEYDEAIAVVNR